MNFGTSAREGGLTNFAEIYWGDFDPWEINWFDEHMDVGQKYFLFDKEKGAVIFAGFCTFRDIYYFPIWILGQAKSDAYEPTLSWHKRTNSLLAWPKKRGLLRKFNNSER